MAKSTNTDSQKTEIVRDINGKSPPADVDNLMTTIRSRVAGRVVITDGPGTGQSLSFYEGSNSVGRDAARNVIALDFGDAMVHRDPHAYLTCKNRICTLAPGGQQNPVKLNGKSLTGTVPVSSGDVIELGKTTLRIEIA